MLQQPSQSSTVTDPLPLHELISHLLIGESARSRHWWSGLGTLQWLNQRLANQPLLDFFNATLRGIAQVIFVNNPVSGLLILIAMSIQSSWLGVMSLLGTAAATLTAMLLNLIPIGSREANRDMIQNGIFGLNGLLVGAAMAFFGAFGNGAWNPIWAIATAKRYQIAKSRCCSRAWTALSVVQLTLKNSVS